MEIIQIDRAEDLENYLNSGQYSSVCFTPSGLRRCSDDLLKRLEKHEYNPRSIK